MGREIRPFSDQEPGGKTYAERQAVYDDMINRMRNANITPNRLRTPNGHFIAYVLQHAATVGQNAAASAAGFAQWHCNECARRIEALSKLSIDGRRSLVHLDLPEGELADRIHYQAMNDAAEAIVSADAHPTTLLVLPPAQASVLGYAPVTGTYKHWSVSIDERHMTSSALTLEHFELVKKALHRYLPLFPTLKRRFSVEGASVSLALVRACLDKATYGNKFMPAFDWFAQTLLERGEHSAQLAQQLLLSPVTSDGDGTSACCPFYHTVNGNIIDFFRCRPCRSDVRRSGRVN